MPELAQGMEATEEGPHQDPPNHQHPDLARAEAVKAHETIGTTRAIAEANRRAELAKLSAQSEAANTALRASIAAENEKSTAKDKAAAIRELAAAEKAAQIAQSEANRAHIEAENARSDNMIAMELEKSRLNAMPKIITEMVKPAEKIKSINVNHISGMGHGVSSGGKSDPVGLAMDSIMDMAVQLPLLKKKSLRVSGRRLWDLSQQV